MCILSSERSSSSEIIAVHCMCQALPEPWPRDRRPSPDSGLINNTRLDSNQCFNEYHLVKHLSSPDCKDQGPEKHPSQPTHQNKPRDCSKAPYQPDFPMSGSNSSKPVHPTKSSQTTPHSSRKPQTQPQTPYPATPSLESAK
jgi:hypothetical protein